MVVPETIGLFTNLEELNLNENRIFNYLTNQQSENNGLTVNYTDLNGTILSSVSDKEKFVKAILKKSFLSVEKWESDESDHSVLVHGDIISSSKQEKHYKYLL